MPARADYPPLQFAGCRIALGVYLAIFFGFMAPYAGELLSAEGVVPDVRLNLRQVTFPNVLLIANTPSATSLFAVVAAVAGVLLALGLVRRAAAGVLWYALACVAHRNTMLPDPSTPFTGWLLLATLLVPTGEPLTVANRSRTSVPGWRFPPALFAAIWIVLGVSYSVSGLVKSRTAEWIDGRAVGLFLANALHRNGIIWSTLSGLPAPVIALGTWAGLGAELLAAPLALWRRTRPLAWLALVSLHLVVLGTMRTPMLSLGALLPLAFAFDAGWLAVVRRRGQDTKRSKKRPDRGPGDPRPLLRPGQQGGSALHRLRDRRRLGGHARGARVAGEHAG